MTGGLEATGAQVRPLVLDVRDAQQVEAAIVADTVMYALSVPSGSVVGELVIVPRSESSWP